jgi:hypothetical protein
MVAKLERSLIVDELGLSRAALSMKPLRMADLPTLQIQLVTPVPELSWKQMFLRHQPGLRYAG